MHVHAPDKLIGVWDPPRLDQVLTNLLARFERAVPGRKYGGLGLGLYIAQQVVDAHGGRIHVESEPGRGSTFVVQLPRRPLP